MSEDTFKFPSGMKSSDDWQKSEISWGGIEQHVVEAIQRDAVVAARLEAAGEWEAHDCSIHTYHVKGGITVCDGCHRPVGSCL